VDLSGPSKFLFVPVLKRIKISVKIGRKLGLHGKFAIPHETAHRQILELMEIKAKHLEEARNRAGNPN
jgi:hypothetical protein